MDRLPDHADVQLDYPVFQHTRQAAMRNVGLLLLFSSLIAPLLAWFGNLVPIPYLTGGLYTAAILFAGVTLALGIFGRWWPTAAYVIAAALIPILILLAMYRSDFRPATRCGRFGRTRRRVRDQLCLFVLGGPDAVRHSTPHPPSLGSPISPYSVPHAGADLHLLDVLLLPITVVFLFLYVTTTNGRSSLMAATSVMVALGVIAISLSQASEHFLAALYGRPSFSLRARATAFINALLEWVNYNRLNTRGVGVHRSAVENCAARNRLLIGVVAAWACLWAGFQIAPVKSDRGEEIALDFAEAALERETSRIRHVPDYPVPPVEPPPMSASEQEFVNRLPAAAREQYLTKRKQEYLNSSAERLQQLRDGTASVRPVDKPADQLIHFLAKVGSVTVKAIVPCLGRSLVCPRPALCHDPRPGRCGGGASARALAAVSSLLRTGKRWWNASSRPRMRKNPNASS